MDDQQGITGKVFDAIRDQLVRSNDWAKIVGTLIIADLLWFWSRANHTSKTGYIAPDVVTAGLIFGVFVLLGFRGINKPPPSS